LSHTSTFLSGLLRTFLHGRRDTNTRYWSVSIGGTQNHKIGGPVANLGISLHSLHHGIRIETQPTTCISAFQHEFNYVCRTLRRLGVQPADIEDTAHEVYLVLSRRWDEYDQTRSLRTWLFPIVFGVASSQRRRYWREFSHANPDAELEVEDPAPHPERAVHLRQMRALVVSALDRVPIKRRAILVMHDIDQVPMREIALTLEINMFTAYSRLRKARLEFRAAAERFRMNRGWP
jgi:RNA polymerase sigma-70 factor (ECF subfamily)